MSEVEQDLDPDSTTGTEFVIDSEEELIKECEELWKDMENCPNKWLLIGTETLTNSNAQLSLLMMQAKCLTAEFKQWQNETPEVIPLTDDVLTTLEKEELQKLKNDLEIILLTIQSKNKKLKEDFAREQQWLDEQQQIIDTLTTTQSELESHIEVHCKSRLEMTNEMKAEILIIKEFKEKLLIALGEFLEYCFPLPGGKTKRRKTNVEPTAQLITLNEIIEILINRIFDVPHDPYVQINASFWPPYIELLLCNGIALRHPEDPNRIKLEAFHQ
ncbi:PREDICTED: LOW QUALITY PROTEIN: centromere protein K-like [Dipodomys ordii]|uniref:LOW QUALITY PROTEIN: centromere protein K-like n=1 Tax=Dipodomys ordii TaxID=10020 RepID=A0A1S3FB09_DIPOR|nr:PREDICTED: LOW QUALITY PROTEIN: centromere protein K-like [Dipodomys ordii]